MALVVVTVLCTPGVFPRVVSRASRQRRAGDPCVVPAGSVEAWDVPCEVQEAAEPRADT